MSYFLLGGRCHGQLNDGDVHGRVLRVHVPIDRVVPAPDEDFDRIFRQDVEEYEVADETLQRGFNRHRIFYGATLLFVRGMDRAEVEDVIRAMNNTAENFSVAAAREAMTEPLTTYRPAKRQPVGKKKTNPSPAPKPPLKVVRFLMLRSSSGVAVEKTAKGNLVPRADRVKPADHHQEKRNERIKSPKGIGYRLRLGIKRTT